MMCLLFARMVFAQQKDLQPLVTIKLNKTESITVKDLKNRCDLYKIQTGLTSFTTDQKVEILDSLINEKLVLQAASKAGLALTDTQVNELFLNTLAQQVGQIISEADFAEVVRQQTGMTLDDFFKAQLGMNVADYKVFLKNQYLIQQYILMQKQNEIAAVTATDAEIRSYYDLNRSSLAQNDIIKMFLVVVEKSKGKTFADSLHDAFVAGTETMDSLRAKGQTGTAGFQAGDMYVSKSNTAAQQLGIDYNGLLQLFANPDGFYSAVTETANDYQFYKIITHYDAKLLALSDVVTPDSTTTVYEYIREILTQQKQSEYFATATQEITDSLRTPANYQMLKKDAALTTLLEGW